METDAYQGCDASLMAERALQGFENVLGIPRRAIPDTLREPLLRVLRRKTLRCSPARAVIEGRLSNIPPPLTEIPLIVRQKLLQSLTLLDALETLAREDEHATQDRKTKKAHGRSVQGQHKKTGPVQGGRLQSPQAQTS